jgi:hypothetical protein
MNFLRAAFRTCRGTLLALSEMLDLSDARHTMQLSASPDVSHPNVAAHRHAANLAGNRDDVHPDI